MLGGISKIILKIDLFLRILQNKNVCSTIRVWMMFSFFLLKIRLKATVSTLFLDPSKKLFVIKVSYLMIPKENIKVQSIFKDSLLEKKYVAEIRVIQNFYLHE